MSEREPRPQPEQLATSQTWEVTPVADALGTPAEASRDVAFGEGARLQLGTETAPELELYPLAGVVRLTTQDAEVTLFRQPPPAIDPEHGHVHFASDGETERLRLTLAATGDVTLLIAPMAPGHEKRAVADPEDTEILVGTQTAVLGHSSGSSGPSEQLSPTPERQVRDDQLVDQEPRTERLNLSGRLGRAPAFRTTRNGTLIATFPLAVRDEDGTTTWHTILAFGERAERLRDQIEKGQTVEVIGYRHEREVQTKRGTAKTVEEIYATVIKPR